MDSRIILRSLLVAAVGILFSFTTLLVHAQVVSGQITGLVTDNTGAVVPGATVHALNVQTNVEKQAITDGSGAYRLFNLIPGAYTVSLEKSGFKKFVREN